MYAWGWNERGQLGKPSKKVREVVVEKTESGASDRDDLINVLLYPELVEFPTQGDDEVVIDKVSCGSRHTAALSGR